MDYGVNKRYSRAKLPLQVIRGFSPTEPDKLSSLAPAEDGEAIKEGMLIVKNDGNVNGVATVNIWRKAIVTDARIEGTQFFIATHDQDSHDVQAAGGLVGLDCSDDYEIQTGYYVAPAGGFLVGMALTAGADGVLTEATTLDIIVARVTKVGTGTAAAIAYVGKTPSTDPATPIDAEVVQVKTVNTGLLQVAAI
jgi:hypothetical protein